MKKLFRFVFLIAFASFAVGQAQFMDGPIDKAFDKAMAEGKMVLIDFFSDG